MNNEINFLTYFLNIISTLIVGIMAFLIGYSSDTSAIVCVLLFVSLLILQSINNVKEKVEEVLKCQK